MPGDGELQGPVGYDERWLVLAALALALVAAYYLVVLWWYRDRTPRAARSASSKAAGLARLDEIESAVRAGRLTPRQGHQQVSRTVRSFVASTVGVPAEQMTLADLRRESPGPLAALVALIYPAAFAEDDRLADDRFDEVLGGARELVGEWT